ncbi:MAG: GNAT family N-acetyltransferase [Pseudonocardia sp.]|nr:GNAT family N-acetyltransferase [Pseudonocardia sp.]
MFVRLAGSSDGEAIARVFAAVAEEGSIGTQPPVDIEAHAARFQEMLAAGELVMAWVVEADGRVVGYAGLYESGPPGVVRFGMALLLEARGQGFGRALLEAILEQARTHGAHKVELEVWPDNARAVALYARAGFEVEGMRRDHYRRRDGSLRSTLLMACLLTDASGPAARTG